MEDLFESKLVTCVRVGARAAGDVGCVEAEQQRHEVAGHVHRVGDQRQALDLGNAAVDNAKSGVSTGQNSAPAAARGWQQQQRASHLESVNELNEHEATREHRHHGEPARVGIAVPDNARTEELVSDLEIDKPADHFAPRGCRLGFRLVAEVVLAHDVQAARKTRMREGVEQTTRTATRRRDRRWACIGGGSACRGGRSGRRACGAARPRPGNQSGRRAAPCRDRSCPSARVCARARRRPDPRWRPCRLWPSAT